MEEFEERRRDLIDPNVDNCSSATFEIRIDEFGRKIFTLVSCDNWGDVSRVSNGNGSSYGDQGSNQTVLSEDKETSPLILIDRDVATISRRCSLLCVGCRRHEPVAEHLWPGVVPKIVKSRRKIAESLGIASTQ